MKTVSSQREHKLAHKMDKTDGESEIIHLILQDHKPLKKLIKKMTDDDAPVSQRVSAFKEFAPLLIVHAKAEEGALYGELKKNKDLRQEGFESATEHSLADEMVARCKKTAGDEQAANIKVLGELVQHHIEEEETDVLPDFKKQSDDESRARIGSMYLGLKDKISQLH